ncbi:helix-turn-helix domain-containing protein [Lacimicrobium alkaliphilum]|uniref:Transcriptional regulator n=1 Tax=Lacimicrobium alkaliphilum TaxID=1526571 RepID=A0ABQ1RKC3_9ALTE|nr:helix-turn-helix transcriptional regulator [Lacimicrobium alkaliphilum]GGD69571.1 transcriptional regulator [Lacimicrobium alkaliphilum]
MAKKVTIAKKPDLSQPADMRILGQFIRHRRTSLNMTLEDAASLCGLSKQAYSNVERGVNNIRVETLFKALDALGVFLTIQETEQGEDDWI